MIKIKMKDQRGNPCTMYTSEIISIDDVPWDKIEAGPPPDLTELQNDVRIVKAAVGRILLDFYPDTPSPTLEPQSGAGTTTPLPPEQDNTANGS